MVQKITKQEALERFGGAAAKFDSYYKFSFTFFACDHKGKGLKVIVGGIADDIYRFDVTAEPVRVEGLISQFYSDLVSVEEKDGVITIWDAWS